MALASNFLSLNDGHKIPQVGLGCCKTGGEELIQTIHWATQYGYRHIDTATHYYNESDVGKGVRTCGVPRDELFVVSKMWPSDFRSPVHAIEYSLQQLDVNYLDAYLLHWPGSDRSLRHKAWEAILEYREKGLIRSVGVSNFLPEQLDDLITAFGTTPVVNQVELHPWYPQWELCDYCHNHAIRITSWGPVFRGRISEVTLMEELGRKYDRSPVQVTLRWHIQRGLIAIPKSSNESRIAENINVFDFEITDEDMGAINALETGWHFGNDPKTYDGGNN